METVLQILFWISQKIVQEGNPRSPLFFYCEIQNININFSIVRTLNVLLALVVDA